MKSFKNKVAAITGAGSGIGRSLAIALAADGAEVALSDVNEQGLEDTAALVKRSSGGRVTTHKLDVADRKAVQAWADSVVQDHGRVNMIFNNAGVGLGSTIEGVSYDDFEWIMNINFWGVVYGTKSFLPYLRAAGEGHVINVSSVFGLHGAPGNGAYNASKFAVRGFTEALRLELEMSGGGVSCTSVHPGGIKTNIARSSRISENIETFLNKDAATARDNFEQTFITTPESAARTILRAVQRNKRRVLIGPDALATDIVVRLFPSLHQHVVMAVARRAQR